MAGKRDVDLPDPERVTLGWLKQHLPLGWWRMIFVVLFFTFGVGFAAGSWDPISTLIMNLFTTEETSDEGERTEEPEQLKGEPTSSSKVHRELTLSDHIREIRPHRKVCIQIYSKAT